MFYTKIHTYCTFKDLNFPDLAIASTEIDHNGFLNEINEYWSIYSSEVERRSFDLKAFYTYTL